MERPDACGEPSSWNFKHLAYAWAIGAFLQQMLLPCLCYVGTADVRFGLVFDALILVRMLVASRLREKGRGWIFYALLCYTSPFWILFASSLVHGH